MNLFFIRKSILSTLIIFLAASAQSQKTENLVQYVNPIIGTERMGHVYPGATVPFGMVQALIPIPFRMKPTGIIIRMFINIAPVISMMIKPLLVLVIHISAAQDILIWATF